MAALAPGSLSGRKILIAVTGSIAAYKTPPLFRELSDAGADLKVIVTRTAEKFVGIATFSGLGGEVFTSMWEKRGELHVELAEWAELIIIAPATADCLSSLAHGRADDLLSATALCFPNRLVVAPAMHPNMWRHPATQANIQTLRKRGVVFLGPVSGSVASGAIGMGRMEEPQRLAQEVSHLLKPVEGRLTGHHLVITAGPTRESIDPVRSLTNMSSGRMGYALAAAALTEGAEVTLISGPVNLPAPPGAHLKPVETALEMQKALDSVLGPDLQGADALIMTAAVSDYRAARPAKRKLKRSTDDVRLRLTPNPDILAELGHKRVGLRPVLVGFALETASEEELLALGRTKLIRKQVDLIVVNRASESLGRDDNIVQLVSARDCKPLDRMSKIKVAAHILEWIEQRLKTSDKSDITH